MLTLRLPSLGKSGAHMLRSRPLWLKSDGHWCLPGEPVVLFNINFSGFGGFAGHASMGEGAFADERTLQIALAPRIAGRLRIRDEGIGGLQDLWGVYRWDDGAAIAGLEPDGDSAQDAGELRALFLAGQRMTWEVDAMTVPLPGWNARARAWWGDRPDATTLVSVGLCDGGAVLRGNAADFNAVFAAARQPMHVVHMSEHPLVHCTQVLLDQLDRTDRDRAAIAQDLAQGLASGPIAPTAADFQFIGALTSQLSAAPLTARHPCITPSGIVESGPARFVLLSLASETHGLHRHKRLGYHVYLLGHSVRSAGPATRAMLKRAFEPVKLELADIAARYRLLADRLARATGGRLIVLNRNSTDGKDGLVSYAGFAAPLGRALASHAAREHNAMLDDLRAEGLLAVIDIDARAAELGTSRQLADGIHFGGDLERVLRADLLALLEAR